MDLNNSHRHHPVSVYPLQLDHALEVIAAALSAVCWLAYQGDIACGGEEERWRWQIIFQQHALKSSADELPHQSYPAACKRLAEDVQRSQTTAHELVLGGEAAHDTLRLHRLAWLVVQPSGRCNCFEFIRDDTVDGYNHSDQRVLSVLAQELVEPLLFGHEYHTEKCDADDRALDVIGVALSRRQREVLAGLVAGQSVKEVARQLNLSPHTVNDYVKAIYRHFDVCSRGELLAVVHGRMRHARRTGLSHEDSHASSPRRNRNTSSIRS